MLARERVGTVCAPATHRGDVQHVDVDSLELLRPRSVGVEHLALWATDRLGLRTRLEELGIGSIVARMARPGSERATRRWLGERSALDELLGVDFATMGPMRLYRASDALMAHREAIEHHLFDRAVGLFDLPAAPDGPCHALRPTQYLLRRRGAFAAQGPPRTLQGQTHRLSAAHPGAGARRQRLRAPLESVRRQRARTSHAGRDARRARRPRAALVVMDRGIATEDRVQWLREQGYRYLVVSRERTRHFDAEAALRIETASSHGVHLHKVLSDDAQEVRLYCFSKERAAKERGIVERFAKRFEDALTKLSEGLSKPRTQKRLDKVWQRIGRLKENSRGVAQHYDVELDTDPSGQRATAIRFERRPLSDSMMTHPGVYCLRSNQTDWDEATLWRTYFTLTDLEAVRMPVGRRCAASSKDSSASPPPSDAPTARRCMCARPPAPNRPNRPSTMPWASTRHREGSAKQSSKPDCCVKRGILL